MNTHVLQAQIKTLTERVMAESADLENNLQYRSAYAMESLGRVLADMRRIEAWNKDFQLWQEDRLMLDRAPSLKDFMEK